MKLLTSLLSMGLFLVTACGTNVETKSKDGGTGASCTAPTLLTSGKADGKANVFSVDPISESGSLTIAHSHASLDQIRSQVNLDHLLGKGVLSGTYATVKSSTLHCGFEYGPFSAAQDFSYTHGEANFQDATTYYAASRYRAKLDSLNVLYPKNSLTLFPHCMKGDNAFYYPGEIKFVCLGDSTRSPGSYYADDSSVVIHESQHAVTMEAYSPTVSLGDLPYDEAGALNEGLSDVMSLLFLEEDTNPIIDSKIFSRWALGTFISGYDGRRTVHKCPSWSTGFPGCASFPSFSVANDTNVISYQYPDGLGWNFGDNVVGPGKAKNTFLSGYNPEEIHNTGVLAAGAVWDYYEGLKIAGMTAQSARDATLKYSIQALMELPKPTDLNRAPVTMKGYAQKMVEVGEAGGLTQTELNAVKLSLKNRGLFDSAVLGNNWAKNPSALIEDNPNTLRSYVISMGIDPKIIKQNVSGGINQKINKGETIAIWIDIENQDAVTAGGVLMKLKSLDTNAATLLPYLNLNPGFITSAESQIMMFKINGTQIVNDLKNLQNVSFNVPTGATYFKTNPYYSSSFKNSFWMQISDSVATGQSINFELILIPTNGPTSTLNLSLKVE